MTLVNVSHLSKSINGNSVLHDVSFAYESFRRVAVAGETGSGKTTLLKAIAGLVQPDEGTVFFEGQRVLGPNERLLPGHARIAYLSQHFELRNNYRLFDFLTMASTITENETARIYELCQIDHLLKRRTDQLSGGERQRAALARLLTTSPRLLVLDEPFSNLDGLHKKVLKQVLHDIIEEGKTACLMVSHDPADILPWAEDVLVLKEGKVVQKGTPQQVYQQPESDYTGGLFGGYNLLPADRAAAILGVNAPAGKKVFIRPENIELTQPNNQMTAGTVTSVYFFGSYFETEISFNDVRLIVKGSHAFFQKGDRVNAVVGAGGYWLV